MVISRIKSAVNHWLDQPMKSKFLSKLAQKIAIKIPVLQARIIVRQKPPSYFLWMRLIFLVLSLIVAWRIGHLLGPVIFIGIMLTASLFLVRIERRAFNPSRDWHFWMLYVFLNSLWPATIALLIVIFTGHILGLLCLFVGEVLDLAIKNIIVFIEL
jgi:hypothetical protein